MKFGTDAGYKNLSSNHKFRENRRSDRHTVLTGINEFLIVLSKFIARFGGNSVQKTSTKQPWAFVSSIKIGEGKTVLSFLADKTNYIHACTVYQYDILKANNAFVNPLY